MRCYQVLGILCLSAASVSAQDAPKARYTITDLGTLGGDYSTANAINNNGIVVGQASNKDDQSRAVKWVDGKIVDCGFGGGSSNAMDINDAGEMVGYNGKTWSKNSVAVFWDKKGAGAMLNLPDDWKAGGSALRGINNKGQVVGYGSDTEDGEVEGNAQGFMFRLEDRAIAPYKGDDVNIIPNAINDKGEMVFTVSYEGKQVPWKQPTELPMKIEGNVQLFDINEKGEIAACLNEGKALLLKTEGNEIAAIEVGAGLPARINNLGVMVGIGEGGATLFENRQAIDLNTLIPQNSGWKLNSANGINDLGQIVGFGEYKDSKMRAYLLTPTKKVTLNDLKLPE